MKVEFCKGAPEDRQDILDFGDLVFSKNSCPHDFQALLPKLYGPQAQFEPLHYMVKEDGKIRAMICVLPMEYQVGDDILKINGVGTVSVHPVARSRGYMKKLLAWALATSGRRGGFSTQGYYAGTILPLLLIAGVGLWASLDFGGMWEILHRTLIPDGIFPADELVMQLFPETLFSAYLPPVLLMLVLMLAAVLVLPLILSPVSARIAQSRAESAGGSNR